MHFLFQVCAEVCSPWKNEIKKNHTRRGKLMWVNSEPHLWSQDKWEVAKVSWHASSRQAGLISLFGHLLFSGVHAGWS